MAVKSINEQIKSLDERIEKLEAQKKNIEAKLADVKQKKCILEERVDLGYIESIKALGVSLEDLMELAKIKASSLELDYDESPLQSDANLSESTSSKGN